MLARDGRFMISNRLLLPAIGFAVALGGHGLAASTESRTRPTGREPSAVQYGPPSVLRVTPFIIDVDVRDLPAPREWKPGDPIKEVPRRFYLKPGTPFVPVDSSRDPLVDRQMAFPPHRTGLTSFTSPTRNFPGIAYTGVAPPDTVGDVGPSHIIQAVNGGTNIRIWDKATPTPNLLASFNLDSLGSGACANGFGDPIVIYDRHADRWVLIEFVSSGNDLCVYVSQTSDPVTGGWYAYSFVPPSFPDYLKLAVWPTDANSGGGSFVVTANGGVAVHAMERGPMLSGAAAGFLNFNLPGLSGFGFETVTPADIDGPTPPPTGAPAVVMRHRDTEAHGGPAAPGDLLEMWHLDVDWETTSNTTLTQVPSIDVADFSSDLCGLTSFSCIDQPNSSTNLDPLREMIMHRLQYINHDDEFETLVGNFVVDVSGTDLAGIRWFELRRTGGAASPWTLHQEGTYSIDSDSRWMGASAMDLSGNIALAYNISSSTTFPGLRYTGRKEDDPLGVMTAAETTIVSGTSPNGTNRYGDYAAMGLDPADDCTFWFTGEYNLSTIWSTRIASFRFDQCGCLTPPGAPFVTAMTNGDNRIDVSWNDSDLATITEYSVRRSQVSGGPYEVIATVSDNSPGFAGGAGYTYEDFDVSGGTTYYYIVRSTDGGACDSGASGEVSATATGVCTLAPTFDGVRTVSSPLSSTCELDLTWNDATLFCGAASNYNVYRSLMSGFSPSAADLIASLVPGNSYADTDNLSSETNYYYVVRAVDLSNDAEEANTFEGVGFPQGPLAIGTWTDNAGDLGPARMIPSGPWSIDPSEGNNGPQVYKTGSYGDNTCGDLRTPPLQLTTGSVLSFYSKYDIENDWDKGEVQISTDGGSSWSRLEVGYPSFSHRTADACGFPLGDYFTGTDNNFALYSADLSAFDNLVVRIRFLISSDTSVQGNGWWIDDIAITQANTPGTCVTSVPAPLPAEGLLVLQSDAVGQTLDLSWDVASCVTADYNLLYGTLANVSSYALLGAACSMGNGGTFTWNNVPGGNLFFLIVGTDSGSAESSWGVNSSAVERNGPTPSGECGASSKDTSGTCP